MLPNLELAQWVTPLNAVGFIAVYIALKLINALYLSPLRHIPGPLFAKSSGLYTFYMDMAGCRAKTIASVHQKYGPVVQIGPSEVCFDTMDAIDAIYGPQSECIKAKWYDSVTRDGVFKIRNIADHRHRRKQISRGFSPATANELEPSTVSLVQKFIGIIEEQRQKGAMEMRHWFRMLVFDLAGVAFVGESNGALQSEKIPQFVLDMDNAFLIWDLEGRFPLLMWFIERLPIKSLQHFLNGTNRLYDYSTAAFEKYIGLYGRNPDRKDIVSKLVQKPTTGVEGLSDDLIKCEIANLTFAATDTTSVVLSYLFWELALNPELQSQLRAELQSPSEAPDSGVPAHQSLVKLPLLNAIIQETMRKHSPIAMGLLRETPPSGSNIGDYFIPGETVVSMSTMLAHKNPTHFPDPNSFKPSRWMSDKSDPASPDSEASGGTEAMKKLYMPFGKGRHKCAGQAMALVTMRIIVAALVLKYGVRLAKDAKVEDMDWDDHFLIILKRGCFLDFTPV
ncbi:pisatin demethylase [Tothia fuscella]|uniref:Pisatin demethylase n=1 Tax=Tothia fuscella TaxID=1048955 RepID=A0A9P4U270_9PEZI|nr:pisatin demethylase [Tothia fuscella]